MKIGILTLPNAINYGGVLQALGIQEWYRREGHEAVLVNYLFDRKNVRLKGLWAVRNPKAWIRALFYGVFGSGQIGDVIRHWRTMRFSRRFFKLTDWQICRLDEAPKNFDVDVVSVGSDQIWNPWVANPDDFLLEKMPWKVPVIAYAASMGVSELPKEMVGLYRSGLARFAAIGVREKQAQRIVAELGYDSAHVADPTLLVGRDYWRRLVKIRSVEGKRLVCYFLDEDIDAVLPSIMEFARGNMCKVDILTESRFFCAPWRIRNFKKWWRRLWLPFKGVHIRFSPGPIEFVTLIANSTWVVANSFHALMFATIFGKDIRLISPAILARQQMTSRLTEFADSFICGKVFVPDVKSALCSIESDGPVKYNEKAFCEFVNNSREWLRNALTKVGRK